jgi:valyl-tRNA synthetase
MKELPTRYNPKEIEDRWRKLWENKGYYHPRVQQNKKPYSIVIPPPNVTGILHMGHALNNSIQDVLIRYKRMAGFNAEWTPGTDHAGIATQNVVEKDLAEENKTRESLGRERFIEKVWEWTKANGGTIIQQLKRLGCSCDWQRERFTLDKKYTEAVTEAFIRLYKDKLIYRGSYIINWCPRCRTALSDEEAPHREIEGQLYYIKYPLEDSEDFVVVATTRPETMFGDTALCLNPKDKRYKHLAGRSACLPIIERKLKIIEDARVDPEFGTGIVKVTPLHDAYDFELGNDHNLEGILCINEDGTMNINATGDYAGLDRFEARAALVEDLNLRKLLVKTEPHTHSVGHCYRCQTVIEPYFSEQWFVRMKPLAESALKGSRKGRIKFHPARWFKIYTNWMKNIKDWCISRQIWWGHRIPVYYCKACHQNYTKAKKTQKIKLPLKVSEKDMGIAGVGKRPESCPHCGGSKIIQDPDVLDTWFSSWLWPFAVYGWPNKTEELDYFYPTSALVTASEIIFFWVARMIMAGLYFMKDVPFSDVFIHGTVRDDQGRKMSKSLGNAIDPEEVIDQFGADALRFSLLYLPGEDLYLSRNKFEFGRNFTNKVWNASRFILMNLDESKIPDSPLAEVKSYLAEKDTHLAEEWILSNLNKLILNLEEDFKNFRFNEASRKLYDFFWHKFCDWYIEFAKLNIEDRITQITLVVTLRTILKLLHPFIPFITEEIFTKLPGQDEESIMTSSWPKAKKELIKPEREELFEFISGLTTSIRNKRAQFKIPSSIELERIIIRTENKKIRELIKTYHNQIKKLAKVKEINVSDSAEDRPPQSAACIVKKTEIFIPLKGLINFEKERIRISSEIDKISAELEKLSTRLKNKKFLKSAPKEIIQGAELRKEELKLRIGTLKKNLKELQ